MGDRRDSEPGDDDVPAGASDGDADEGAADEAAPETPDDGDPWDDKMGDPSEYIDEDTERPDWVEEAKQQAAENEEDGTDEEAADEDDEEDGTDDARDDGAEDDGDASGGKGPHDPDWDRSSRPPEASVSDDEDDGEGPDEETAADEDDEEGEADDAGDDEDGTDGDDDVRDVEGPEKPAWAKDAQSPDASVEDEDGASEDATDVDDTVEGDEDDESYEIGPDDTASATGKASAGAPAGPQPAGAGGGGGGMLGGATAPDDEEMPLTEHVEEMALRFMAVGLVVVGVGAITLFYADELINFLWYSFLGPGPDTCLEGSFLGGELTVTEACPSSVSPRVYHPLALVLARLKVASLVGLIAALPVAVYQTYRFMRPGLYPRERRYYLAAVPTSLVLATVGVGFAYFAILPAMFSYFTNYSEQAAEIAFGLTETFNLIVLMIGFFALVFQIPLLVMLAIMMGVTTRRWLEDRRLYFWGGFAAVAFVFSPDPTGMAPLMVAVTMIVLFEGTLFLLRWTDSDSPLFSPVAFAERRPYAWALAVAAGYLASAAPVPGSYYDRFPDVVRETLRYNELVEMTPVITAVVLVLLFELVAYLVRNYSRDVRVWHAVNRSRFPYWMLALVVGYFASPNPPGLQVAQQVALPMTEAVALTAGLVVGFELLILVLRWRKKRLSAE